MRRIMKITAAIAALAIGFTAAAIAGTTQPASATFCIQWDAHAARPGTASTGTPEIEETVEDVPIDQQAGIALPDPDPSVICLIIKPKVYISHG